jgi:uncharacterized RDD family membrane protein YckC
MFRACYAAGYLGVVSNRQAAAGAAGSAAGQAAGGDGQRWPGRKFGLPEDGPRSVAGIGARLIALIVDWGACEIIAVSAFRSHTAVQLWTLLFFAAETWLLIGLTGGTLGMRLLRMRVARIDGKPVGLAFGLIRTILLLLVVPPLVMDSDLRGLHDRAARTIVIRA